MKKIILIILLISLFSLLTIYSSTYPFLGKAVFFRQSIWLIISFFLFLLFIRFNYQKFWDLCLPLYFLSILLLVIVLFLGDPRLGAKRWIQIFWLNFQPSELAKFSIIIFLSRYYAKKPFYDLGAKFKTKNLFYGLILPFLFVLIPIILILLQPDLGTSAIFLIIFLGFLYTAKVRVVYILGFILSIFLLSPFLSLLLRDYQRQRILVFLNPNYDPLGAGYTIIQSKIAIGSGRIFGKGWLSGTQSQLQFLPSAYTDFIFSSFAEERGFSGCLILIFLYYLLINRIFSESQRNLNPFGRLISYGIFFMLTSQIIINICMTLGLLPVVGIPLPFFSYGGSSLLMSFICLGVFLNIIKRR